MQQLQVMAYKPGAKLAAALPAATLGTRHMAKLSSAPMSLNTMQKGDKQVDIVAGWSPPTVTAFGGTNLVLLFSKLHFVCDPFIQLTMFL